MENQIYNSSVIVENYQVHYSFKRQTPQKHLNVWGKYYQWVHQQKQIQKFLEAYFLADGKPKVDTSAETMNIQIRFHNGERATLTLNMTHTVSDIHGYIMAAAPVDGDY